MKKITMFYLAACPHCKRAFDWMEEAKKEDTKYADIEMEMIEESEQPDMAEGYDYYYVPTYFIGEEKVHEGVASLEIIKNVFDRALED